MSTKTTQWRNGAPPPGVYERRLHPQMKEGELRHFSRWDGRAWMKLAATPKLAAEQTQRSLYNARPWEWREVDMSEWETERA